MELDREGSVRSLQSKLVFALSDKNLFQYSVVTLVIDFIGFVKATIFSRKNLK